MSRFPIDRWLRVSIGTLLAALLFVIYDGIREKVVEPGDSAPQFAITADNGRRVSRDDFGGRLLVLNFWATWCPPCIEEMPSLDRLQRNLAASGVVVLGVSVDKDQQAYRQFLDRAGVSFLTARDPQNKINAEYGTFKYPETYIISGGKVLEKVVGPRNWTDPEMVNRVKALL